ncbi:MAG: FxsA family protein [Actinomycetota bacterium]
MFPVLFFLLILVPIAELYVIVQTSQAIGIGLTLLLLIGISIAGAWLLKREGTATWRLLQESLRQSQVPTKHVTDGALILLGGALLLTPGFITDAVGFLLVLPPTRAVVKNSFRKLLGGWALKRSGPAGYIGYRAYEARVKNKRRRYPETSRQPPRQDGPHAPSHRSAPSPLPPADEDDSRDTG